MPLLAYHGRQELKEERIGIVRQHRELDLLAQGKTGQPSKGEKGCAVACTVDGYHHARYPVELGIPLDLAYLEDRIFEGLSVEESRTWPERFLEAVPVGADLSRVGRDFARLVALEAVLDYWPAGQYEEHEGDREIVVGWLATGDDQDADAAYRSAADAATAAYRSASAAADAAYRSASAASAAAAAAADAAYRSASASASAAASAAAARGAAFTRMADQLLAMIREAPVTA